ncbi:MAG: carbamoyltransferase C-terminal domain-containing protein [Dehalococcoidia bacterium]
MNARLRDEGPFRQILMQPAAGDAGTALGAACVVDARERRQAAPFAMTHALRSQFQRRRSGRRWTGQTLLYPPPDIAVAADLLAADKIAGWFQGRMEFGPRALGARSIVASPADPNMKDRLNAIKDREEFRPVAQAVLEERAADWFAPAAPSPFMLFVHRVRPERRLHPCRARHIDGTARIETVNERDAHLPSPAERAYGRARGCRHREHLLRARRRPLSARLRTRSRCAVHGARRACHRSLYLLVKGRDGVGGRCRGRSSSCRPGPASAT